MDHERLAACAVSAALLLGVRAVIADPLAEVHNACEGLAWEIRESVPLVRSGTDWLVEEVVSAAMEKSCVPLIERLASLPSPSPEERLALLKARRGVVYAPMEQVCEEVEGVAEALPDHPDALYRLALCADELVPAGTSENEVSSNTVARLERALKLDPRHHDSLLFLTRFIAHPAQDTYGLSDAALARHRVAYYEVARGVNEKLLAALNIYEATKDGADLESAANAAAIRERVRTDLGLDDPMLGDERVVETLNRLRMDFGLDPLDPDFTADFTYSGPLQWACSEHVFALDLEDACLSAIETAAEEAAAADRPLNDIVPSRSLDNAFKHLVTGDPLGSAKAAPAGQAERDLPRTPLTSVELRTLPETRRARCGSRAPSRLARRRGAG